MKLDIHYFLSSKHAKWLIISLIFFFSLLTLTEFISLFWISFTPQASSEEEHLVAPTQKNSFDSILSASLFGVYVANDLDGDNVKKSTLNISLVGILLESSPDESQVIIRSANGEEQNYKVDDKIPGGALIKRIMSGGILVEHEGNLERVSLPKNELIFEPLAKPLRND
jgi:general secretion pathway protein C